jgi:hypothetical protein
MTVVSASLALMVDAGFVDFWIQISLLVQTDPAAGALFRMQLWSPSQKNKRRNPRTQGGKIESSAAMKAASAPLARMAGVVSAA